MKIAPLVAAVAEQNRRNPGKTVQHILVHTGQHYDPMLSDRFFHELRMGATSHVEIETYTFDVLPPEIHPGDMVKSIAREFAWVQDHL